MHATRHNGLAGKARRMRDVSRAHRLHMRQLLDEYQIDDGFPTRPERFIPVRNRYEFLPSAVNDLEDAVPTLGPQLELALAPAARAAEAGTPTQSTGLPTLPSPTSLAAPEPRPTRLTFTPLDHVRRRRQKLTPGGFVFGCALGSAAAAVVLLVLQLTVG